MPINGLKYIKKKKKNYYQLSIFMENHFIQVKNNKKNYYIRMPNS